MNFVNVRIILEIKMGMVACPHLHRNKLLCRCPVLFDHLFGLLNARSRANAYSNRSFIAVGKKPTRQWAAWTRQEEESFFVALRQVGKANKLLDFYLIHLERMFFPPMDSDSGIPFSRRILRKSHHVSRAKTRIRCFFRNAS